MQANAQDQHLTAAEIPQAISAYVQTHFPDSKIVTVKKDRDLTKVDYEVRLSDSVELTFDKQLAIQDIESKKALPKSVVPEKISQYVSSSYPNSRITGWEKKNKRQKVELGDDLELYFDQQGNFLRVDD